MTVKKVIYKDKDGNKLCLDSDGKLAVRNKSNRMVSPTETKKFLNRKSVKNSASKYFKGKFTVIKHKK